MANWIPIKYKGFYDVPLVFLVSYQGDTLLFDCPFDESAEEYSPTYKIYRLPAGLDLDDLPKDWTKLHQMASRFLGEIPVERLQFDPTGRREIDASILDRFLLPVND